MAFTLVLVLGQPATANPVSATTTTGQGFEAELDVTPAHAALGDPVLVDGSATLSAASSSPVNYLYVVDVSGSMENPGFNPFHDIVPPDGIGPEDDCNSDGIQGSAMDAACFGLLSLNESFGGAGNVSVGLVAFGDGAVTADVDPSDGDQTWTSPPNVDKNSSGTPDMEEVIRSVDTTYSGGNSAGVRLFTDKFTSGFASRTHYDAALTNMNSAFEGGPEGRNITAFISDGNPSSGTFSTGEGSPLAHAAAAGTLINTFAIGSIAPGSCAAGEPLQVVAEQTGGVCTEVDDPSSLSAVFSDVLSTRIIGLELFVNGVLVEEVTGAEAVSMSIPQTDVGGILEVGANEVVLTATAADGTTVSTTVVVEVADLTASIAVTKTADPTAVEDPGGTISYTVTVTNDGQLDVEVNSLTDDVFGDLDGLGDCSVPFMLAAGETMSCTFTGDVTGSAGDSHVSTVLAAGTYAEGSVSAAASATVSVVAGDTDPGGPGEPGEPGPEEPGEPGAPGQPSQPRPGLPSTGA